MARSAPSSPEALLARARAAVSPHARAKYASRGLGVARLERDTQLLLLRQLLLAHAERENYAAARLVAEQMVSLGEWVDVAHSDAANLCVALGDYDAAIRHCSLAARTSPAHRRSKHYAKLGRRLGELGRRNEAAGAFQRARRWATDERVVWEAELALLQAATTAELCLAYDHLQCREISSPLDEFLASRLLWALGHRAAALKLLENFVEEQGHLSVGARLNCWSEHRRAQHVLARESAHAGSIGREQNVSKTDDPSETPTRAFPY